MSDSFSMYVVMFKDAANHPRADCLLARSRREAVDKAVSQVKERYGVGSHVACVSYVGPANLPVLLRDKFIHSLEATDEKIFAAVQVSRISAEMIERIESTRESIQSMIEALKETQELERNKNEFKN